MNIYQAQKADINKVTPLFIAYLHFYQIKLTNNDKGSMQDSSDKANKDPKQYLLDRISNNESIIYLAENNDQNPVGFTQLYPTFCSLEMKKIWILYDLFVTESARSHGVAQRLLDKSQQLAKNTDSAYIMLSTGVNNVCAQRLYERNDYKKKTVNTIPIAK